MTRAYRRMARYVVLAVASTRLGTFSRRVTLAADLTKGSVGSSSKFALKGGSDWQLLAHRHH